MSEFPKIGQIIFTFSWITRDTGYFPLEQDNSLKLHFPNFCFTVYPNEKKKSCHFPFLLLYLDMCSLFVAIGGKYSKTFFLHNENICYSSEITSTVRGETFFFTRLFGQGKDVK